MNDDEWALAYDMVNALSDYLNSKLVDIDRAGEAYAVLWQAQHSLDELLTFWDRNGDV